MQAHSFGRLNSNAPSRPLDDRCKVLNLASAEVTQRARAGPVQNAQEVDGEVCYQGSVNNAGPRQHLLAEFTDATIP